ncbi:hypothetical protein Vadar_008171 [Vaccinium darrowii]|uniref:Uncharacterized protein n=1 Tax=Vaccinium darrowii TaxID=229202 RepID=A0ACB7XXK1_9ERIC|nr:hypothetical protein Vadar_008171 [Vaccinium darrowii]
MKRALLLLNVTLVAIGSCGCPMVMRLYFTHGGSRVWLASWLETAGWPVNFIPLLITYLSRRRKEGSTTEIFFTEGPVFVSAAVIGTLTGFEGYLYAYGVARLPVSTSTLVNASKLSFTAVFAFLIVKQKFTPYSINAVVLITVGAGVLALHTSSDQPKDEPKREYYVGFFLMVAAAALCGLGLTLVELIYKKARQAITYTLVLEIQVVMCFFATLVCTMGMVINKDFQQKFTPYSINAVALVTIGARVLALHTSSDLPKDELKREYYVGFVMTAATAALCGFTLTLVELAYKKA